MIDSRLSNWSHLLSELVIDESDKDSALQASEYYSTITEPVLHDNLTKEEKNARQQALISQVTLLLSSFPFGLKYDKTAMESKILAWVTCLSDMPYWAIKKAIEDRMRQGGPEPSAGDFRNKNVWPLVSKYDRIKWIINSQIKALQNEKDRVLSADKSKR